MVFVCVMGIETQSETKGCERARILLGKSEIRHHQLVTEWGIMSSSLQEA